MLPTIAREGNVLVMIDQRKLPGQEVYVRCSTAAEVARAIRTMVIRGAPAIGVFRNGRNRREIADMMGCTALTVPFRVPFDGDLPYEALLTNALSVARDLYAHDDVTPGIAVTTTRAPYLGEYNYFEVGPRPVFSEVKASKKPSRSMPGSYSLGVGLTIVRFPGEVLG